MARHLTGTRPWWPRSARASTKPGMSKAGTWRSNSKHAVEEAIREGGVPYTILRPGYFMQNDRHLKPLLTGHPVPVGNQRIAVVDVRDIAEAAAISLTE